MQKKIRNKLLMASSFKEALDIIHAHKVNKFDDNVNKHLTELSKHVQTAPTFDEEGFLNEIDIRTMPVWFELK